MTDPIGTARSDGQRLAKRVAAQATCSRREAELYIESGAVTVDGVVVEQPEQRVHDGQQVVVAAGALAQPLAPVTLLWNKPAGVPCPDLPPPEVGDDLLRRQKRGLACATPLSDACSGLVVYTQHSAVQRRLHDTRLPLEHEYLLDADPLAADAAQTIAARLRAVTGLRASLSNANASGTRWRVVSKVMTAEQVLTTCQDAGLTVQGLRRQRIGRVALGGLAHDSWRWLDALERF